MATMLAYILTDAAVDPSFLGSSFRAAVDCSLMPSPLMVTPPPTIPAW